jgi:outer membrane lipoprotein-sorting protein
MVNSHYKGIKVTSIALVFCALLGPCLSLRAAARLPAAEDILERSRAKYASLKSYSDTGTVTTQYHSTVEQHAFTTYYRAPRQFFFEFRKNPKESKERYVIWCPDGEDFQDWWSATGNTSHHGRNPNVFVLASYPTKGSVLQIPPLLFPKAEMQGPISGLKEHRLTGTEDVNGRSCYKLVGELALAYKTGAVTEAHPTTVWIDVETLLVRKVFEDASSAGSVSTTTTTFEPQANPTLDERQFKFTLPSGQE